MKFFHKNHFIYTLLLAIGFFWCGSSYLSQEAALAALLPNHCNLVNIIAIGIGSFAMAIGIILFSVLCKLGKDIKRLYEIFLALCAVMNIVFWFTDYPVLKFAILIFTCLIGTAGFGAGYHFALLGNKIHENCIGRCFAVGYAVGAIGTYLLTIVPGIDLFASRHCLWIYLPVILLNLLLIIRYGNLDFDKNQASSRMEFRTIAALGIMTAIMALLADYSTGLLDFIMKDAVENVVFCRSFYSLGLILAGIIADKNRKFLEFTTIFSLLFSLVVCVFIREGISASIMQSFCYFLTGFFAVFRTVFFIDLGKRDSRLLILAGMGLAISRVIEGFYSFVMNFLIINYLVIILILIFLFMLLFLYYYFQYDKAMEKLRNGHPEKEKTKEELFRDFSNQYSLTRREEEVLLLLLEKKSGKEIAEALSISTGTVKNISSKIYKKTAMKKEDIVKRLNS